MLFGMVVPCIRSALFHIHTKQNENRKPHHEHEEKNVWRMLPVASKMSPTTNGPKDELDYGKKKISMPARLRDRSASYLVNAYHRTSSPFGISPA